MQPGMHSNRRTLANRCMERRKQKTSLKMTGERSRILLLQHRAPRFSFVVIKERS